MLYFLDTNILIYAIRNDPFFLELDTKFNFFSASNATYISIVSEAEIKTIALRINWGVNKLQALDTILNQINKIPIVDPQIVNAYCDIDAYSQGKHPTLLYPPNFTARNMGKNDIWIAATASIIGAKLITTDEDFNHLSYPNLVDVEFVRKTP